MRRPLRSTAVSAVVVLLLTGCGSSAPAAGKTLNVYAAASLQAPFSDLASEFEDSNPGVSVQLNFAGSSDLATQIIAGAPADVFASANPATMERVSDEGLLASPARVFATNVLTIVVGEGNPLGIDSLDSLADPAVSVVLCAPQVPCGSAAETLQQAAAVSLNPVSEESSVTDVVGKVSSGQADAGLVYVTDAKAAEDSVDAVPINEAKQAENLYPIAVVRPGNLATEFADLVAGERGRDVLSAYGFGNQKQ
ncbi:molybdate ABC transporter substrate-binding protein [Arthrobacter sp. D2-10]